MRDERWSAILGLLAFAGLALGVTACGNNGSGRSVSSGSTGTPVATPSPKLSQPPSPVTSAGTPQTVVNPNPPAGTGPSPSPSPGASGAWLWVALSSANSIEGFPLDAATGALGSGVPTSLPTASTPQRLAVDGTNKVLVASLNGANAAAGFLINRATGALTASSPPTAATTGTAPVGIAIDPQGKFVFTGNDNGAGTESISTFSLDLTTAVLTPGTSVTGAGTETWGIAIDPAGTFLYASNYGSSDVAAFTLANGVLTAVGSTNVKSDQGPHMVVTANAGKFVYTANLGALANLSGTISIFKASNGALTPGNPTFVAVTGSSTTSSCREIVVDPSGKFLFSANGGSGDIAAFTIDQTTGNLTPAGTNASLGGATTGFAEGIVCHPTLQLVYVSDTTNNQVVAFPFNGTTGVLGAGTAKALPASSGAFGLAISQ